MRPPTSSGGPASFPSRTTSTATRFLPGLRRATFREGLCDRGPGVAHGVPVLDQADGSTPAHYPSGQSRVAAGGGEVRLHPGGRDALTRVHPWPVSRHRTVVDHPPDARSVVTGHRASGGITPGDARLGPTQDTAPVIEVHNEPGRGIVFRSIQQTDRQRVAVLC